MKNIEITVLNIISLFLVFAGIVVFINGIIIIDRKEHLGNLDSMKIEDLKKGYYVQGDVSSVLGNFDAKGNFYATVCCNLDTMEDEYIIPMGKQYITISVPQEYKNIFETFTGVSAGHSLLIKGKIVTYKNGLHYEMLKSHFNLKSKAEVNAIISEFYIIKIVDEKEEKQVILKGIVMIISGAILFFGFDNPIRQYRKLKKQHISGN